jgi:hypothetical protein
VLYINMLLRARDWRILQQPLLPCFIDVDENRQ